MLKKIMMFTFVFMAGGLSVAQQSPAWSEADVPAAYRAMVCEHIMDRFQHVKDVGHVYRDGEATVQPGCPQYTVTISIVSYKPGNQVQRAMMGPLASSSERRRWSSTRRSAIAPAG